MFGNKILDFKDELLKDLNTLLSFESVLCSGRFCRVSLNRLTVKRMTSAIMP